MATELLVQRATWEASGVLGLELVHPGHIPLPPWEPGAHIDLTLPSGTVRQYSLCGDSADRSRYRIGVLREEQGRGGSVEAHTTMLVGSVVRVSEPRNHFPLVAAPRYLFVAGGIGITPILAMARHVAEKVPWSLVYGGRSLATMAYRAEVAALAGGDVTFVPQNTDGLPDLAAIIGAAEPGTAVYCCGPEGMLREVERIAAPRSVHMERFGATAHPTAGDSEDTAFEIELGRSGLHLTVPAGKSVLQTVLEHVPTLDYSCEEGYCGTCETRVLAGIPAHRDTVLSDAERETGGTMMICVSRAKTPSLTLDLWARRA